jgi:hypothetical protein
MFDPGWFGDEIAVVRARAAWNARAATLFQ